MVPGQMTKAEQAFVLNTMELLLQIVSQQQLELQSLKDEINRLKGEQGKPDIPGNTQKDTNTARDEGSDNSNSPTEHQEGNIELPKESTNHSSEEERKDKNKPKGKKG